jgi:hypothetical protein
MFYTEIWLLRNCRAFCFREISLIFPSRIFHLLQVSPIFSQILAGPYVGKALDWGHYQKRVCAWQPPHTAPSYCNALDLRPYPTCMPLFYLPQNNWPTASESKLNSQINMSSVGWGEPNELFIPLDPTSHVSGPEFWRHACTVTWTFPKDECWLKHSW